MTSLEVLGPARARGPVPARLSLSRPAVSPVVGALLFSRLLVVIAGVAGDLAVPHRLTWQGYDPQGLSTALGRVGNALTASAVRFDSIHLLNVAAHGYRDVGNTVFYPLYPLLVRALGAALGSDVLAGIAISLAAFAVALTLLARLTALELGPRAAPVTVALLALLPWSFFFSAVYTESLFLALSLGAVLAARTDRWRAAIPLAALAALTRVTGLALVVPLGLIWLGSRRHSRAGVAAVLAAPVAVAAYLGWLAAHGLSATSPFSEETLYGRQSTGPLRSVVLAVEAAARGARDLAAGQPVYMPTVGGPLSVGAESMVLLVVLIAMGLALGVVWRRLGPVYAGYTGTCLLLCLWSPQVGQPLTSLDRYTLTIFPVWMVLGEWLAEHRRARLATYGVCAGLLGFLTFQVAGWAFVA